MDTRVRSIFLQDFCIIVMASRQINVGKMGEMPGIYCSLGNYKMQTQYRNIWVTLDSQEVKPLLSSKQKDVAIRNVKYHLEWVQIWAPGQF